MTKKTPNREPRLPLLLVQDPKIEEQICRRIANYTGNSATLSAALGALVMGQHYGWRALRMIHSPSTVRKYERVLGVRFEQVCLGQEDGYTDLSDRIVGIYYARKIGAFWDVVMGRKKLDGKTEIREPEESLDA